MKKIFTLAFALCAFAITSFGQCVPDTAALSPNQLLYPSVPHILQDSIYSAVLSLLVPDSVPGRDFNNPYAAAAGYVIVDSINIQSITGYPTGINSTSNPSLGSWIPVRGYACTLIAGTTTAPVGNYPLTITGIGCGHITIPLLNQTYDTCMPFNFSSLYPYVLQVCDTVCNNIFDTVPFSLCRGDSIQWGSNNIKRAGTYIDTVLMSSGCDSMKVAIVTMLNPPFPGRDSVPVTCRSVSYLGNTYTSDTTITLTFANAAVNGCDSSARYIIVVGGLVVPTITATSTALTAVDPAATSYQWLQNGAPISGATAASYSPTGPTQNSYTVVATDRYGCADTSVAYLASGITSLSAQDIRLYPNPNNGTFILETHNALGMEYSITNSLGQIVEQKTIGSSLQSINMGSVATGVYTISIRGMNPIQFTVTK